MECFPKWLVWTLGTALVLAGAQMAVLAFMGLSGRLIERPPTAIEEASQDGDDPLQ